MQEMEGNSEKFARVKIPPVFGLAVAIFFNLIAWSADLNPRQTGGKKITKS
jgi:hypothetical protein